MSIIINRNIIFLASNHFYKGSLDGHASNLEDSDFKHLISEFSADKLEILKRKGLYPYEWVDSYEKFNNKELPPKECFYSSIKDGKRDKSNGHIYEKEYLDLKNFWKELGFNTFIDFHNHYLKKDVLLLADVFEKFISTCLKNYNLDPCHYFSALGLSWDAMLKMTKVELEKISDPDMHLFIEKGMRGGISYINKRYSEANNENCPNYDNEKPKRYINYLDMNNLYGYAMSQYLPYGGFKWIKITSETVNKKLNEKDKSLHGYVLEVDLDYPENLHKEHSDYPMVPEKIKIKTEWLSPYCLEIKKENNMKVGVCDKLTPNLMPKNTYVVHYRNFKYYLSKELILKKVRRILEFKQSEWIKSYIDFNTQERKEATNKADKDQFKLLNNAVYGKTMENMRKRIKIRIIKKEKDFIKHASRPTYITHTIFGKRVTAIREKKELLVLNKPIYVGC